MYSRVKGFFRIIADSRRAEGRRSQGTPTPSPADRDRPSRSAARRRHLCPPQIRRPPSRSRELHRRACIPPAALVILRLDGRRQGTGGRQPPQHRAEAKGQREHIHGAPVHLRRRGRLILYLFSSSFVDCMHVRPPELAESSFVQAAVVLPKHVDDGEAELMTARPATRLAPRIPDRHRAATTRPRRRRRAAR